MFVVVNGDVSRCVLLCVAGNRVVHACWYWSLVCFVVVFCVLFVCVCCLFESLAVVYNVLFRCFYSCFVALLLFGGHFDDMLSVNGCLLLFL